MVVDKRDNMVFATEGYFLKLAQVCLLFLFDVKQVFTEMETFPKHPSGYLVEVNGSVLTLSLSLNAT